MGNEITVLRASSPDFPTVPFATPSPGRMLRPQQQLLLLLLPAAAFALRALPSSLPRCVAPCRSGRVSLEAVETSGEGKLNRKVKAYRKTRGLRPGEKALSRTARQQGKAAPLREIQKLYVTGGDCRGRKIRTPDVFLRPMMSRVREALFSILYPSNCVRDSGQHLDLFAGAGTVGIEALSRGMGKATFVDFSPTCTQTIRDNLETLGLTERGRVLQASCLDVLRRPESFGLTEPFTLVTMTPPYEEVIYAELMDALATSPLLAEDTMLVIEYPVELGLLPPAFADGRFVGIRNRRYGRTVLAIYVRSPSGKLDLTPYSEEFVSLSKK